MIEVALSDLVPFELRAYYDYEVIVRLGGSILQNGLLTPLLVRPKERRYQIIDGNYRFKALRHIGWKKSVPVISKEMSDKEALETYVISNWHRRNFRFQDKARAVKELRNSGFTPEEITIKLEFKHPKSFYQYLDYEEKVSEKVRDVLKSHSRMTRRHGKALLMLRDAPDKQRELAERIVTENLTGPKALREADRILHPEKYERVPKPWKCSLCGKEQSPEETKTKMELCPECCANLLANRQLEAFR